MAIPILAVITLIATQVTLKVDCPTLDVIRVIAGTGFFLSVGLPFVEIFTRKDTIKQRERLLFTMAVSLLLLYPAGLINLLIEGKENIYQHHLTGLVAVMIFLFAIGWFIKKALKIRGEKIRFKSCWGLFGVLAVGLVLRIIALGEANLNGDEIDLAQPAYDLVDGMVAGRNGYFLSQVGHSPLGFYIAHAFYNLLEPGGFYEMKDWMIRAPQVLMGMLTIFGTYVLGRNLLKEKYLAYVPAFLVAIDSYSNFASRLAIFQDLSTFAFFVVVFILAIRLSRLVGVSLGSLLLVKFSGILFVPMVLLLEKWRKRIKVWMIALAVFTPVIVYNIAAYITTGYMDVSFTKLATLIGIPAESIMTAGVDSTLYGGFRSPLATLGEMPFMLLDQWGVAMSGLFAAAAIVGIYFWTKKKSKKEYLLIFSAIALTVVFFSLNGFRTYYMPYLSVLFAMILALDLQHIKKQKIVGAAIFILVVPYTLFFNINTNILLQDAEGADEVGRSGDAGFELNYEFRSYSFSANSFLEDRGWDELLEVLPDDQMLIIDDKLNYLSVKWYLQVDDIIREFHGDENYQEAYEYVYLSEWDGEEGFIISREHQDFQGEKIIYDKHGNEEFYVYSN